MLRFLRVQNLAVIESVEVDFSEGFNVLTGETGAGKSILVGAVGLLLGGRASADLVRSGEQQASIEAIFEDARGREIVVRREINAEGRSRAFVDGVLTTAAGLRDLAAGLVELHGQHEHHVLLDPAQHVPTLDEYAGVMDAVATVAGRWREWCQTRVELERSQGDMRDRTARLELLTFQLDEIEGLAPRPGEDDELAISRQVLASAERLTRLCAECYSGLYEGDDAVLGGLAQVWKRLGELASLDPVFETALASRDAIKAQLEDVAQLVRRYADTLDVSPERRQQIEDRLSALDRVKRKHGGTLDAVLARAEEMRSERERLLSLESRTEALGHEVARAAAAYLRTASELSRARHDSVARFAEDVQQALAGLGMPRAIVRLELLDRTSSQDHWGERGVDEGEIFVSTNPGEAVRSLARTLSGGELSRFMLALKTLRPTPQRGTMVFDEIDAGIGGEVANVVGARLQQLSERCQVLCITHLPQIAARAGTQFRIEKHVRGGRTSTSVERLETRGRIEEIARMIGGGSSTPALRQGAEDLIRAGLAKGKQTAKGESERVRRG